MKNSTSAETPESAIKTWFFNYLIRYYIFEDLVFIRYREYSFALGFPNIFIFWKNVFDLYWFSELMFFSQEKNVKNVSIENPTKCQGWFFFLNFLTFLI